MVACCPWWWCTREGRKEYMRVSIESESESEREVYMYE